MGKIVISENITLDGVVEDPSGVEGFRLGGWVGRVGDRGREGAAKVLLDEALGAEAQLFGRRTYEFLAARWPFRSGALADRLNKANCEMSIEICRLMFIASTPSPCGAEGGLRNATSIEPQSTTSNEMSKLHSFRFCCRNSFIGSGSIWPEPLVVIMILALTGLSGP